MNIPDVEIDFVRAEEKNEGEGEDDRYTRESDEQVTSQGLFIPAQNKRYDCTVMEDFSEVLEEREGDGEDSGFNIGKIISDFIGNRVLDLFGFMINQISGENPCEEPGELMFNEEVDQNIDEGIDKDVDGGEKAFEKLYGRDYNEFMEKYEKFHTNEEGKVELPESTPYVRFVADELSAGFSEGDMSCYADDNTNDRNPINLEDKTCLGYYAGIVMGTGDLVDDLPTDYGSMEEFKEEFTKELGKYTGAIYTGGIPNNRQHSRGHQLAEFASMKRSIYCGYWADGYGHDPKKGSQINGICNDIDRHNEDIISEIRAESSKYIKALRAKFDLDKYKVLKEHYKEEQQKAENGPIEGDIPLGIVNQINIFTTTVNVTDVEMLMGVTGFIQNLALILMIFFVFFQAFKMLRGADSTINEASLINFVIRFAFVMLAIYLSPAIMQDILSLNNIIIDFLGQTNVEFDLKFGSVSKPISVPTSEVVAATFASFLAMGYSFLASSLTGNIIIAGLAGTFGVTTVIAIIALILAIAVMVPILKLIIWWYTRLFKIFVATALMPLFLITFATDSKSFNSIGQRYATSYVVTVFEQLLVVLGFVIINSFIVELPNMAAGLNIGFLGMGIALYAALTFLSQLPDVVASMVSGGEGFRSGSGAGAAIIGGAAALGAKGSQKLQSRGSNIAKSRKTAVAHQGNKIKTKMGINDKVGKDDKFGGENFSYSSSTSRNPELTSQEVITDANQQPPEEIQQKMEDLKGKDISEWTTEDHNFASDAYSGIYDGARGETSREMKGFINKKGEERDREIFEASNQRYLELKEEDPKNWSDDDRRFMKGVGKDRYNDYQEMKKRINRGDPNNEFSANDKYLVGRLSKREEEARETRRERKKFSRKHNANLTASETKVMSEISKRERADLVSKNEDGSVSYQYELEDGRQAIVHVPEPGKNQDARVQVPGSDDVKGEDFKISNLQIDEKGEYDGEIKTKKKVNPEEDPENPKKGEYNGEIKTKKKVNPEEDSENPKKVPENRKPDPPKNN